MKILFSRGEQKLKSHKVFDYDTLYIVKRFRKYQYVFLIKDQDVTGDDINEFLKKNLTCDYFIASMNYDVTPSGEYYENYFGNTGLFIGLTDHEESIVFSLTFNAERI